MSELRLGRVQGNGIFYSSEEPDNTNRIFYSNLGITTTIPLEGDFIVTPSCGVRQVISGPYDEYVIVGDVVYSIKGEKGDTGVGFRIHSKYDSDDELPEPDEQYVGLGVFVGTEWPLDVYVCLYLNDILQWYDIGQIVGPEGPQGPEGVQGPAGTIRVGNVETGEAGSDASVENVGTDTNAIFDFVIPKGDPGQDGKDGKDGQDGKDGEKGDIGYVTMKVENGMLVYVKDDVFTGDFDLSDGYLTLEVQD